MEYDVKPVLNEGDLKPEDIHEVIRSVNNVYKEGDPRPKLKLCLNGNHEEIFLYDTGAMVTLIKASSYTDTFEKNVHMLKRLNFKLQSASGSRMQIQNVLSVSVQAFKKKVVHTIYVVNELNVAGLLGIPLIKRLQIGYDPVTDSCFEAEKFVAKIPRKTVLSAKAVNTIDVKILKNDEVCKNSDMYLSFPGNSNIQGNDMLVHTNEYGIATIELANVSDDPLTLTRNWVVGEVEKLPNNFGDPEGECEIRFSPAPPPTQKATSEQMKFIRENAKLDHLDARSKEIFLFLLYKNYDIISFSETDLGACKILEHSIPLTDETPIFVNQYPVPLAHIDDLKIYVRANVKADIMERTISDWNTPLFFVPRKDANGKWSLKRPVQDFRKINERSIPSNFRLPLISEVLQDIGRSGTKLYTSLDLKSSFHQIFVKKEDRKKLAFTVPNMGQFTWKRCAMGLRNVPAVMQRLMNIVLQDMIPDKCLAFIDDILLKGTGDIPEMAKIVQECFDRLRGANLKINLGKSLLASPKVTYLGHELGPEGYSPTDQKISVIRDAPAPNDRTGIKSFLGMTGFFREFVPSYTKLEMQLTKLTRQTSTWHSGKLPDKAMAAFVALKKKITSKPILAFPEKEGVYHLYVDGSQGDAVDPDTGGVAGVLLQEQSDKKLHVISYFSRPLKKHEKSYTVFMTEMLAATASIEAFSTYLIGQPNFFLYMDHVPIVSSLTKNQTRTLNRLQQLLLDYSFTARYVPGPKNISDWASRIHNVKSVEAVELQSFLTSEKLLELQESDPVIQKVHSFLSGKKSDDTKDKKLQEFALGSCSIKDNLVYIEVNKQPLIFAPSLLHADLIAMAHESLIGGHCAVTKTLAKIQEQYSWPGIRRDVQEFYDACPKCHLLQKPHLQTPIQALPQPDAPLEVVHCDLHGPLATVDSKSWILIMKDEFTKYAVFVALPSKSASVVASAMFHRWVCQFGSCRFLISDRGGEFVNAISAELMKLWQIKHNKTSPYHAQCNASAEILNKFLVRYLTTMLETSVVEWPLMLGPLQLSYNVGINKATNCTPFFLLHGVHARTPYFDGTYKEKVKYGQDYATEIHQRLMLARAVAKEHNIVYRQQYEDYHNNSKVSKKFVKFEENDIVWLHRPELQKSHLKKITLPWEGPYSILKLTPQNALIQHCASQKTRFVHRDRLRKVLNQQISYEKIIPENEKLAETEQKQQSYSEPEVVILNPDDPTPMPKQIVKDEKHPPAPEANIPPAPMPTPAPAPAPAPDSDLVPAPNPTPVRIKQEPRSEEEEDEDNVSLTPESETLPASEERPMPSTLGKRSKAPILSRAKGLLLEKSSQLQTSRLTRSRAAQENISVEDPVLPKLPLERKKRKK